jgi:methionyl-tRNA synthetase
VLKYRPFTRYKFLFFKKGDEKMASYEDFQKLDIKVAEIESVTPHPNADRLYVLGIKVGEARKQIVAGIRAHYTEEQLKGKKIVIIDNLDPAIIRGVESQGMLLAASDAATLTLVVPERPISDGAKVK